MKKRLNRILICALLLLTISMFIYTVLHQQEHSKSYVYYPRTIVDANYKLFYGEWEVVRILSENYRFGATVNAEDLIGDVFYYNYDVIKQNGDIVGTKPAYRYYIIPMNDITLLPYMQRPQELGIKGEFSIFVEAFTNEIANAGNSFYVKDDETLILFENDAYYEMKRVSHIKNYLMYYEHL